SAPPSRAVDGLLLRLRRRRLDGGGGRGGGGRGGGQRVDLPGQRGELLLLRVRGLAERGDALLQLLALLVGHRDERDRGRGGGVGARVLLDDLRQRLPRLAVLTRGHLFVRLLQQRRCLHVVRHRQDEVDDDRCQRRGEDRRD